MEARTQPLQQARFGILQIDVGYADSLKAQLDTPLPNARCQCVRVNRVSVLLR
jgi:hypothetical protein